MRTYADLVDRLRAYVGNDTSENKSAAVLRAASIAVTTFAAKHVWQFYRTTERINTSAPYSTGTVVFDLTGGANEREITLTGGTFPDWIAGYGTIVIANIPYEINQRISATVCTLKANSSPPADIASSSYVLYRTKYDLPANFASMYRPTITGQNISLDYILYTQFLLRRNYNDGVGTPYMFTIIDNGYGRKQIEMWNPPDQVYSLEFEYRRQPALPVIVEESAGKISLTSGSTAVTGTSTLFRPPCAGAVLRVAYDQTKPTAFDSINPPEVEYLIDPNGGWTSTTSLTLASAATSTVTNRAYTISSRVDVDEGAMFRYLVAIGCKELRMNLRINGLEGELDDYKRAFDEAKSADGQLYGEVERAIVSQCRVGYPWRSGSFMRTIPGNG